MTRCLAHRGPDAQGTFIDDSGKVALGHTRLSIIDLSTRSNQPMLSDSGNLAIVLNGEIYNYKDIRKTLLHEFPGVQFRTTSDTETVLVAFEKWGPSMVQRLEGMFAMCVYDQGKHSLYLFRDRIGKKPLFYYQDDHNFVFASEIKSLLQHPAVKANRPVDYRAIHHFLHLGYVPGPQTVYSTIKKFPQGSVGVVNQSLSLTIDPYWQVNDHVRSGHRGSTGVNDIRGAIDKAVEKRLVSDVPVGSFLSGGTDSSLVTAVAQKLSGSPMQTFSVGFDSGGFDERPYAARVAALLGTDHYEMVLRQSEALELVDQYTRQFDEPFADTSALPTMLVSKFARKSVKVVLTGDGGDELFLGYGAYDWARRLANPTYQWVRTPLRAGLELSGNDRFRRIAHMFEPVPAPYLRSHIFSQEQYLFSQQELDHGLTQPAEWFSYADPVNGFLSPEEKQAIFDLKFYLVDDLLVKVDRASMSYGLECRCPLLDHEVVALALSLEKSLKMQQGVRKWILKKLLEEYLPSDLVHRPKQGFSIPLAEWLAGDLKYLIDRYLSKSPIEAAGVVKYDFVASVLLKFFSGQRHLYNRIWALIVLHKWIQDNQT